jgi:hypothetical protein
MIQLVASNRSSTAILTAFLNGFILISIHAGLTPQPQAVKKSGDNVIVLSQAAEIFVVNRSSRPPTHAPPKAKIIHGFLQDVSERFRV